jgi:hypothetical protein
MEFLLFHQKKKTFIHKSIKKQISNKNKIPECVMKLSEKRFNCQVQETKKFSLGLVYGVKLVFPFCRANFCCWFFFVG